MSVLLFWQESGGAPPVSGTATFEQAAATWGATLTERITATATFTQAAGTWSSSAAEQFTSTASFVQGTATWDATASERFTSTASFVQAAATWDAAALERLTATASWAQDASWSATGDSAAAGVTGTASWVQEAASWGAALTAPYVAPEAAWPLPRQKPNKRIPPMPVVKPLVKPPAVYMHAGFIQQPAQWSAVIDVSHDAVELGLTEESVLALI